MASRHRLFNGDLDATVRPRPLATSAALSLLDIDVDAAAGGFPLTVSGLVARPTTLALFNNRNHLDSLRLQDTTPQLPSRSFNDNPLFIVTGIVLCLAFTANCRVDALSRLDGMVMVVLS